VDSQDQRMDVAQLERLSTGELIHHALEEARLLAKAEVLAARQELKAEISSAKTSAVLGGAALALATGGLSVLFVAVALVIPLAEPVSAVIVGAALWVLAGLLGYAGFKSLPRKPLPRTQERIKEDVKLTREQLQ
jgi:hypothetical protein